MRHLSVVTALFLMACPDVSDTSCTTIAAASVGVTVVDSDGTAIPIASVVYEASDTSGDCEEMPEGTFVCGWEVAGDITVTASAEGFLAASETVHVAKDECHVIEEFVTLTLETLECTDEVRPSVEVNVTTQDDQTPENLEVVYVDLQQPDPVQEDCTEVDSDTFDCGEEIAGQLEINVFADGYEPWMTEVTVDEDECHVITETVDAVLVPEAEPADE